MTPERWAAVDAVLQGALDLAPADRAAFVARACAGDAELHREVESLLTAGAKADDFLDRPAVEADADPALAVLSVAFAGRFALEHELGHGGMATVYLARDLRHKRLVALKVFHHALGTLVGSSRFHREIETAAGLNHPHILPLHDSGADLRDGSGGRLLYYVMPYVAGGSLRERLQRESPLPVDEVLRVVREVGTALDYAHRHGVVHRDIKPENILLAEDGDALVADFGIARALQRASAEATASERSDVGAAFPRPDDSPDTLSQCGSVVGTPAYMSPEQALGRHDIDGRSDQYALGCVVFEMLAGVRPFTGSSAEQLAQRPTQKPPSLAALRPDLPAVADAVLTRALAPLAEERFASATALAEALGDALEVPREVAPDHVERGERASKSRRGLGRPAVALAAVALAIVGGTLLVRARQGDAPRQRPGEAAPGVAMAAVDAAAFDLYVMGARVRNGGPQDRTPAEYFAGAIAKDSTYAPAYAALAFEHAFNGDAAQARSLVNKALALDPSLAEAHMVLGVIREFRDWNWEGAEAALREAIRLNKGYAEAHLELGMLLMRRRRFAEAMRAAQNTLYLAPMSARFESGMGEVHLYSGEYDEALKAADRALAIDSRNAEPYLLKAYAYEEQLAHAKAAEAATECIARGCDVHGRALLGYIHARSGNRAQALAIVDSLEARWRATQDRPTDPDLAIGIAQVYAGLGERARALDWLERSVGREMYAVYLDIDPTFRSLHAEPRFQALLKKLGLAA